MPALTGALIGRLYRTQVAVALALGGLVVAAALVEGHAPDPWRLRALALGGAAALGGAWVLAAFRRERGDVALAALGVAPGWAAVVCLAAALPTLALAGGRPEAPAGRLAPHRIELPGGAVTFERGALGPTARRTDLAGEASVWTEFPAPANHPTHRFDYTFLARTLALALALGWLGRRAHPPDVPAALAAGTLATLAGLAPALLA